MKIKTMNNKDGKEKIMKTIRRLVTVLFSIAMLIGTGITAYAVDSNETITVGNDDNHTYQVFQIFTGELTDTSGTKVLSNVKWGKNGTGTQGTAVSTDVLNALTNVDANASDKVKLNTILTYASINGEAFGEVRKDSPLNVPAGYYLIKDKTHNQNEEDTVYVVKVVGSFEIERKASNTTSDKKLDDINDSDTSATEDNKKMVTSSDYDIGDDVPYHLTAKISEKVGMYSKYHITFEDTLESGKFDQIGDITIKLDGNAIANTDDYTVSPTYTGEATKDGFKLKIEFTPKEGKDLSSLAGKLITIDFTAKLGTGAAIGSAGNKNTLVVKYSNNPNTTDGSEEGTSPEKTVITFTYKLVINKVNENNQPLAGANFTLYKILAGTTSPTGDNAKDAASKNAYYATKKIQTWTTTAAVPTSGTVANQFSFTGIDDGTYVLCETTTPSGYNTMDPVVFRVSATHGGTDGLTLESLTGTKVTGEITLTPDLSAGSLSATVSNKKGSTLPSTGGIGTTVFYVIGGVLVAGAAVMLIAKNKMSKN